MRATSGRSRGIWTARPWSAMLHRRPRAAVVAVRGVVIGGATAGSGLVAGAYPLSVDSSPTLAARAARHRHSHGLPGLVLVGRGAVRSCAFHRTGHGSRHAVVGDDPLLALRYHSHTVCGRCAQSAPPDHPVVRRPSHSGRVFLGEPGGRDLRGEWPPHLYAGAHHWLPQLGSKFRGEVPHHRKMVAGSPRTGLGSCPTAMCTAGWSISARRGPVRASRVVGGCTSPGDGGVSMGESRGPCRPRGCQRSSLSASSRSITWLWNRRSAWRQGAVKNTR